MEGLLIRYIGQCRKTPNHSRIAGYGVSEGLGHVNKSGSCCFKCHWNAFSSWSDVLSCFWKVPSRTKYHQYSSKVVFMDSYIIMGLFKFMLVCSSQSGLMRSLTASWSCWRHWTVIFEHFTKENAIVEQGSYGTKCSEYLFGLLDSFLQGKGTEEIESKLE